MTKQTEVAIVNFEDNEEVLAEYAELFGGLRLFPTDPKQLADFLASPWEGVTLLCVFRADAGMFSAGVLEFLRVHSGVRVTYVSRNGEKRPYCFEDFDSRVEVTSPHHLRVLRYGDEGIEYQFAA